MSWKQNITHTFLIKPTLKVVRRNFFLKKNPFEQSFIISCFQAAFNKKERLLLNILKFVPMGLVTKSTILSKTETSKT